MITAFWSGLGGKLADRAALALVSPAFAFWLVGLLAWVAAGGLPRLRALVAPVAGQPEPVQLAAIVTALLVILGTGLVAERLAPAALRFLQGDWPDAARPLRRLLAARHYRAKESLEVRWEQLYARVAEAAAVVEGGQAPQAGLEPEEEDLLEVERRLAAYPGRSHRVAPTRLGNVLRAAESGVRDKYGIDAARCWPALWLLLPEAVRAEVAEARKALDSAVLWWTWSVLLTVWVALDLRVLALVATGSALSYRGVVGAAARYGELVDASYALHRGLLYDAVRWPTPRDDEEVAWGYALTTALWRGPALAQPPRSSTVPLCPEEMEVGPEDPTDGTERHRPRGQIL